MNIFIALAILAVVTALSTAWQGPEASVRNTLSYIPCTLAIIFAAALLYNRRMAGSVLVDGGPTLGRRRVLLYAGAMFLAGILGSSPSDRVSSVCLEIVAVAIGMARRQIREVGIMTEFSFARWPEIASCAVEEDGAVRLERKHSSGKLNLRVPEDRREEFLKVLEERLGAAPEKP